MLTDVLDKPIYFSFQGEDRLIARFKKMKDGQIRVLRVEYLETSFQISDRIPKDFDYDIFNNNKWLPMSSFDFYHIVFKILRKTDMQVIVNY